MAQGTCDHRDMHALGAVQLEYASTLAGGAAAGEYIVQQQDALLPVILPAGKGAMQVAQAFLQWQRGLRGAAPDTAQAAAVARDGQCFGQRAGNFQRLVETAFAQALTVQGYRHDAAPVVFAVPRSEQAGELGGKPAGEGKLLAIFEGMNQFIDRKIISVGSEYAIKERRVGQTAPAALAESGIFQALWAVRRW